MANKSNPIGVRFRLDILEKLKADHSIDSPQKALVFMERFYIQHHKLATDITSSLRNTLIHYMPPPAKFDAPKRDDIDDEPLSFAKMEKAMTVNTSLFQQYLNGMAGLVFPDDKEDYERKIRADPNLSEKQITLLIKNLRP